MFGNDTVIYFILNREFLTNSYNTFGMVQIFRECMIIFIISVVLVRLGVHKYVENNLENELL